MAKLVHPGQVYDTSSLSFKEDPHSQFALEDALGEVMEVLDKDDRLHENFNQGLTFTHDWRQKNADQKAISTEIAQKILGLPEGEFLPLAGGCWKDDAYDPLLWSFQKNENGELTLVEMSYGTQSGEEVSTYALPADIDQKQLEELIYSLLRLAEKPTPDESINKKSLFAGGILKPSDRLDLRLIQPIHPTKRLKGRKANR